MTIRVLLVDDEAPARAKLRKLLARHDDLEVVAEAKDGGEAVEAVTDHRPDLVFLDIQMPGLDGFGVVDEVGVERMPLTVFATAYDEHALRAFEAHALDYLLKPFAAKRFDQVVERARRRLRERRQREDRRSVASFELRSLLETLRADAAPRYARRLRLRSGPQREVLVPVDEIRLVRADGNYVRVHTADERELSLRSTLSDLASKLDPEEFLRINRSELVRLGAVEELQPFFHGDYKVKMKDGEMLTWSRRYRARSDL